MRRLPERQTRGRSAFFSKNAVPDARDRRQARAPYAYVEGIFPSRLCAFSLGILPSRQAQLSSHGQCRTQGHKGGQGFAYQVTQSPRGRNSRPCVFSEYGPLPGKACGKGSLRHLVAVRHCPMCAREAARGRGDGFVGKMVMVSSRSGCVTPFRRA